VGESGRMGIVDGGVISDWTGLSAGRKEEASKRVGEEVDGTIREEVMIAISANGLAYL
jgi:hypothetical protein